MTAVRLLALVGLVLTAGGCTSLRLLRPAEAPKTALKAGVPTADELAAPYRTQASHLERSGRLRLAVDAWTTALALAPAHAPSRQALKQLRERIDREIDGHLERGWHALARGEPADARRHFLAALALDPESRAARDALRALPVEEGGEVTAKPASPPVRPSTLAAPEPRASEPPRPRLEPSDAAAAPAALAPGPERRDPAALLEGQPPEALYAAARAHLDARRDGPAYHTLVALTRISPGHAEAAALLRDLRPRLVRQRYQEGMRLFREEMLEEAIEQWRGVLEVDPTHVEARRNIEQAQKILRTLAAQPKR